MKNLKIAVIPGDGIGTEVVPEGIRVLEAAAARHGIRFTWDEFPWSCAYYLAHGKMMPEDGTVRRRTSTEKGLPTRADRSGPGR